MCGLPGASSVMLRVPEMLPLVAGSKNTLIEHVEPTGKGLVQPTESPKLLLACTLEMLSGEVPELVTEKFWGSPTSPTI